MCPLFCRTEQPASDRHCFRDAAVPTGQTPRAQRLGTEEGRGLGAANARALLYRHQVVRVGAAFGRAVARAQRLQESS